jgi:hypothetical protein
MTTKKEIIQAMVENGLELKDVPEEQRDKEIVLVAMKNDPEEFRFSLDEPKKDREIVLAAVNHNGMLLEFASE